MRSKVRVAFVCAGLVSLVIAAVLAVATQWSIAIASILPLFSGFLGIILTIVALLVLRAARSRADDRLRSVGLFLLACSTYLLLQLVYYPIALTLRNREVARAQAFAEALIPRLEAYKQEQGSYPETLEPILEEGTALPALLRLHAGESAIPFDNRSFYAPYATSFRFRFYLPDGFIGYTYEYCCGPQGRWTVTD